MHTTTTVVPRTRPVWLVSATAGLFAAVATELYALGARVAGVPMEAAGFGQTTAQPLFVGTFAIATVICTFWGTVIAVLLARFAKRPARTYLVTTVALTALSLVSPALAADTAVSTKLMLGLAHLLAAGVVIPTVSRRLAAGR